MLYPSSFIYPASQKAKMNAEMFIQVMDSIISTLSFLNKVGKAIVCIFSISETFHKKKVQLKQN